MVSNLPSQVPAHVRAFRLQNFMGFEDSRWVEIRPITLLFGRNSTGKSALIRALLLMKQSLEHENNASPFIFSDEGGVDLGAYRNLIHRKDVMLPLTLSFKFYLDTGYSGNEEVEKVVGSYVALSITYYYNAELGQVLLSGFALHSIDDKDQETAILSMWKSETEPQGQLFIKPVKGQKEPYWIIETDEFFEPDLHGDNSPWSIALPTIQDGFLIFLKLYGLDEEGEDEAKFNDPAFEYITGLLRHLRSSLRMFFDSLNYIGPIRTEPQRFYYAPQHQPKSVGKHGEHSIQSLLGRTESNGKFNNLRLINDWLGNSSLHCHIKLEPISDAHSLYEVALTELNNEFNFDANLRDVGFGLSQLFPVLVESVLTRKPRVVIIEQPELHLHPQAQAELGDFFILMSKNGIRFFLETHSENLLLRFRRRLAETTGGVEEESDLLLYHEDFKAYFVDRDQGVSTLEALQFDEWGDYRSRPPRFGDFFGQDFEELMKMKQARRVRRQEGSS